MNDFFDTSLFAGVTISLLAYLLGMVLKKKFKLGIFNPLLISICLTIVVLIVANIDYDTYNQGAVFLSWFLTPATVCLAIPLYEQWQLLKTNLKAVLLGITAGVLTSLCTVFVLAKILHLSHKEYVTLLPKSITTAIGMGVSEELGGYVTITVAVIVVTGVLGNIFGELICKIFRITHPIITLCLPFSGSVSRECIECRLLLLPRLCQSAHPVAGSFVQAQKTDVVHHLPHRKQLPK